MKPKEDDFTGINLVTRTKGHVRLWYWLSFEDP